ncbi:prepilin-type N-terminal cleavage/methylation domain-containing protein [Clostridium niameyense]|uniref:Prepilin-type N-terminal cleavage/methylation domain-containing protein n=1 Tax=Clostridium niameyense TaxID=1622073 RepID=A0A6M0RA67_9CLOT|nr:prepilin-type N-terminal cleavage/methylation domain-containing protein [Clostridium niameyense]NEZ46560.1 prepilin-type N-terminal cleavage/methylation domain-containing protein [Clostridium niameyense]
MFRRNLLKNIKNKKGFTLIELIVVIAIIAIIAAFAIPNFIKVRNNANIDSDINLGRNIAHATEILITEGTIEKDSTGSKYGKDGKLELTNTTNTGDAKKIEEYLKEGTLKLKTKGASFPLTITINEAGKVTKIEEKNNSKNVLYDTNSKPTGIYVK